MAQDLSQPEVASPLDPFPTAATGDQAKVDNRIRDLFLVWAQAERRGRTRSPEDICRDCPELTDDLREEIDRHKRGEPRVSPGTLAALVGSRVEPGSWTGALPGNRPDTSSKRFSAAAERRGFIGPGRSDSFAPSRSR